MIQYPKAILSQVNQFDQVIFGQRLSVVPKNIIIGQKDSSTMWSTSKQLRCVMTPGEKILWQRVRANRLGFHFRRQQIIGKSVVDFYCHAAALLIELDGEYHNSRVESDQ